MIDMAVSTPAAQATVDRAALRAELDATNSRFNALLESLSDAQWQQPGPNTAWTMREIMAHLTWALEQLPLEVASARCGRGMFNYPRWLADPVSYWLTRWEARGQTRTSLKQRYDTAMTAVVRALDEVSDADWDRGARFYGERFYTVADLFHTPAAHLAEHTAGL